MAVTISVEDISAAVESMSKAELKHRLKTFKGLKLDFTDEYLDNQDISRLRHMFLAALTTRISRS
jgi:hypothetical protein